MTRETKETKKESIGSKVIKFVAKVVSSGGGGSKEFYVAQALKDGKFDADDLEFLLGEVLYFSDLGKRGYNPMVVAKEIPKCYISGRICSNAHYAVKFVDGSTQPIGISVGNHLINILNETEGDLDASKLLADKLATAKIAPEEVKTAKK